MITALHKKGLPVATWIDSSHIQQGFGFAYKQSQGLGYLKKNLKHYYTNRKELKNDYQVDELHSSPSAFCNFAWEKIAPIFKDIHEHPFNVELFEGTLCEKKFKQFLHEDKIYLEAYTQTAQVLASRTQEMRLLTHFFGNIQSLTQKELQLHHKFLGDEGFNNKISSGCKNYIEFLQELQNTATPIEMGIAGLMPCLIIYRELGTKYEKVIHSNNPYKDWVMTYSAPKFKMEVDRKIKTLNYFASQLNSESYRKMLNYYEKAAKLEYDFWHSIYHNK